MKVLKFGGSSVGTADSIRNVKKIIESTPRPVIVVVSALRGITDQLIKTSQLAAAGDEAYRKEVEEMKQRHYQLITDVISAEKQEPLKERIGRKFQDLESILQGIFLIQDLTQKSADAVVSYGERFSSMICEMLISGARLYDARKLIKTERNNENLVNFEATNQLIREAFKEMPEVAVMGGFIASDISSGVTTNLGRGGSDYTASILAAALDAEALEIWTDVDGFMTADPHVIPSAYTIDELSYKEATELCNFGAKVVYPPTIFPVCVKNIPIYVKNTFQPEGKGSVIREDAAPSQNPIRGMSSVNETSMVTVSGMSMVGVVGVNQRIFTTMTNAGVSVFMVAQTSSETSISLCVSPEDGPRACEALDAEFASEIADGAMNHTTLKEDLATVAVVGEYMHHIPGIMGKLFSTLGRNGINVCASACGALELNISFVVARKQLKKAMNVIHDSFFLSAHQDLNVFICGVGTVGGSLLQQITSQQERLLQERALRINVVGITNRHGAAYDAEGLNLEYYEELLKPENGMGIEPMVEHIVEMNLYNSVLVDCTASADVAKHYQQLLEHNVSVVAANKVAASSHYDNYRLLKQTARERGVKFLFETNVGAGLPVINTINDLINSGDRILCIEAVLSGTLNYVFNTISENITLSQAVKKAQEEGYSEPDPRIDLSGTDVIRKITILARESGYRVETDDIRKELFLPTELFEGDLDTFWKCLPELDAKFEKERLRLEQEHKHWRFVARWQEGKGSVGLAEISANHPFYNIEGSNNIVLLTTERYREYPMLIQGYGAGAEVTAAGVFADIMRVANI